MANIPLPTNLPFTRLRWVPPAQNQVNRSEWTGARKVVRLPGAGRWRCSAAVLQTTRHSIAREWIAFFTALEGQANTFLLPFSQGGQYTQAGTGATPQVAAGAVQGAETIPLQGLGASGVRLFAGQAMSFVQPDGNTQLVVLTQNLVADGSGNGTATFRAALRGAPAAGTAVELVNPVGQMALTTDLVPIPSDEGVYDFAFDCEEAF